MKEAIVVKQDEIVIRKMMPTKKDFNIFLKWMTDPETMRFWEGMSEHYTYKRVVEEYNEHVEEDVEQCIIEYNGKPIGYMQYCILNADYFEVPKKEYDKIVKPTDLVYGVDMFIGEVPLRSKGLGPKSLKLLIKTFFEKFNANWVMVDPKIHNTRAIRSYEKAGMKALFMVPKRELQDGIYHDSLIMGIEKEV